MKANLPAHEVSFVRLRNRMRILASGSLGGDFCSTFGKSGKSNKIFFTNFTL